MNNEDDLVTLTTASTPIEASLMKSKLESEDIYCFVADANTIGINPLYSIALGGIRVQVRLYDFARAQEVLELPADEDNTFRCPQCHSDKVEFSRLPGLLNLLTFLSIHVFFLKLRRHWTCHDCHHSWKR